MPDARVVVLDDVAAEAAAILIEALAAAIQEREVASFVLAGGGTPPAVYEAMARKADPSLWERVHFFWGDERLVPAGDPGSNYRAAHEALLGRVPVPEANIHRVKTELPADSAVADYAEQLRAFAQQYDPGCPSPWPRFDVVLLGLGEDGHTASIFPGSEAECVVPVMALTAEYQGRPAGRVTLTHIVFNHARRVFFLVSGANKAAAVAGALRGPHDPAARPAQRVRPEEGEVTWLLDRAAAGALDSR